jgi:hypothetical protein
MVPLELITMWAGKYNAEVTAYDAAVPDYTALVKTWNILHAPVAALALYPTSFAADQEALTGALTMMQTADDPPIASTRKLLPEMPYMTVKRPAPFAGPKLSTAALVDGIAAGEYRYEMGAGRAQSGWLTLAASSMRGYGTTGQSATPVSYINPLQDTTTCAPIYLGVIAWPL